MAENIHKSQKYVVDCYINVVWLFQLMASQSSYLYI